MAAGPAGAGNRALREAREAREARAARGARAAGGGGEGPGAAARGRGPGGWRWGGAVGLAALAAALAASSGGVGAGGRGAGGAASRVGGAGPRLVALGDLHGDLEQAEAALRLAGVVDPSGAWAGRPGDLLVQTGDLVDRGPESLQVLRRFEGLAEEAGGAVELILGNHELMNVQGDFRYVNRREVMALGRSMIAGAAPGEGSAALGASEADLSEDPSQNMRELKAGTQEWARQWEVDGRWGSALARRWKVAAVRGEGRCRLLFAHAGISPATWAGTGVFGTPGGEGRMAALNLEMSGVLRQGRAGAFARLSQAGGPLWFRDYAIPCPPGGGEACPESEQLCEGLADILKDVGAEAMVVGHTIQEDGSILKRCPGPTGQPRLFVIDVGMSRAYLGHLAALECQGGVVAGLYPHGREILANFNFQHEAGGSEL